MTALTFHAPKDKVKREGGRPLIVPLEGGQPIAYTRVSTLSKMLDNKDALTRWKQRQVVVGMSLRTDLVDLARAVQEDKRKLDEVVQSAMDAARSDEAANLGTILHSLTENVDDGCDLNSLASVYQPDMWAYQQAMQGIKVMARECFVVNDELQAAGTFDRILQLPDGRVVVADIKTGQHEPRYPHGATTQVAIYANSQFYDPDRGRLGFLRDFGVSTDVGLMIHLPAGSGKCDLYELDLSVGMALARTAVAIQQAFKGKPIKPYP